MPGWHMHNESTVLKNIYFFGAQVNPVDPSSLLAVYPLAHEGKGCVAMSASRDGIRWSRPAPVLPSNVDTYRVRTTTQPASPALVMLGNNVFLYVHVNVPGVPGARGTPKLQRFTVPARLLREWSASVLSDASQFEQ